MKEKFPASFDRAAFLSNFQGMEDLAEQTVASFLEALPRMMSALDAAVKAGNASAIELAAHSLKGAVSNFYAEPARLMAWQLEQIGHGGNTDAAKTALDALKTEINRLQADLGPLAEELRKMQAT